MDGMLEKAIAMASAFHAGQADKGGQPYILHPLRVMMALTREEDRIAAVLHDALEDTECTVAGLRAAGFSAAVIGAVLALTRRDGESYAEFIQRCKANPIARRVKLADLADNSDMSRIAEPTASDWRRLEKYRKASAELLA